MEDGLLVAKRAAVTSSWQVFRSENPPMEAPRRAGRANIHARPGLFPSSRGVGPGLCPMERHGPCRLGRSRVSPGGRPCRMAMLPLPPPQAQGRRGSAALSAAGIASPTKTSGPGAGMGLNRYRFIASRAIRPGAAGNAQAPADRRCGPKRPGRSFRFSSSPDPADAMVQPRRCDRARHPAPDPLPMSLRTHGQGGQGTDAAGKAAWRRGGWKKEGHRTRSGY